MTDNTQTVAVKQNADLSPEKTETIRDRQVFVPRTDIYETKDGLVLVMDVPGVDEKAVEVVLEKSVLTVRAFPTFPSFESHNLAYAEYGEGDYQRSFKLSEEIDREKIEARVKNGVLTLHLAKAAEKTPHKIGVVAG